ncbi:MAG: hypothetical protein AAGC57_17550 [Pseudomonadota bacterium]
MNGDSLASAARGEEPPIEIVLHVPKCAGSTVEAHLLAHLGPAFWSAPKRTRRLPLELLGRKYAARPPVPPAEIHAVSGHFIGRSIEALFPGRRALRSVLLREPKALVLSWYNFRMMRYRAAGQASYPFGLHLRTLSPDPLCHFLLSHWLEMSWPQMALLSPAEKLKRLEATFAAFDFVGDIADCDVMLATISGRLGVPETAARTNTGSGWQAVTGWEPLRLDALSDEDRALLERRTELDACLYARLVRREPRAPRAEAAERFLAAELRRPLAELRRRALRGRATTESTPPA